ncbi:MAG: ABC transporter permease, partial [Oceanospirillum sp.]|nr:ABC transporter permease [Oceanospirillum sp.]
MNWDWTVIWENIPKLMDGALLTLELVFFSGLIGVLLAIPLALLRVSGNIWVRALPYAYIFFFRGT